MATSGDPWLLPIENPEEMRQWFIGMGDAQKHPKDRLLQGSDLLFRVLASLRQRYPHEDAQLMYDDYGQAAQDALALEIE